jgi:type I restriction enzyme S subunit
MPKPGTDGWRPLKFSDIAENVSDRVDDPSQAGVDRYVGLEHLEPGNLSITRWGSPADVEATKLRFQSGDVIFGRRRAYQRKLAQADFSGICSAHAMVLRAKPEVVLPEFLPLLMQTDYFFERALAISVGGLSPTINWKALAKEEFVVPSLEMQRRIAEMLWTATRLVAAYGRGLHAAENARASCLDHILSSELAASRRVAMRDVCDMQNGRPFPSSDYCDEGIRLLRPGNLAPTGYLHWSSAATKFLPTRYAAEARDFLIGAGEVLINLTAQSLEDGFMGRVCLAREGDECLLNQRIGRFRCDDVLLPEFLFRVLQSRSFRRTAESRCGGSKIRHLYWSHIEDYELPLPPVEEQAAIVGRLRAADAASAELRQHINASADLAAALRENWLAAQ